MAKYLCTCGHVINLNSLPQAERFNVIPEDVFDAVLIKADLRQVSALEAVEALDEHGRDMFFCPACSRLHLQTERGVNLYRSFTPDLDTDGARQPGR